MSIAQSSDPPSPDTEGRPRATGLQLSADAAAILLYAAFVVATALLAYLMPLAGDDFAAVQIREAHPGFAAWSWFWYSTLFGRVPAIVASYFVVSSNALFALLAGVTLPVLAYLLAALAFGRRPRASRKDFAVIGFLTVALWFSLPIQWDVFWRSGWPAYSLPAILMLAFLVPYRAWLSNPVPDARGFRSIAGVLSLFLLGVLAGSSSESVLAVLGVLGAAFFWYALARRRDVGIPARLWSGAVGLAIGAGVLLLAPGNEVRAAQTGDLRLALVPHLDAIFVLTARTLFVWLAPAYPWLVCILLGSLLVSDAASRSMTSRPRRASWIWLWAAVLAALPLIEFPDVTDLAGQRTVFYTTLFLILAAAALLVPESEPHALDRIPRIALSVGLALLLLVTVGDVGVNIRYAKGIDSELATRAALIVQDKALGIRELKLPPLQHGAVGTEADTHAIVWGDISANPNDWINRAVASYYGVASISTTDTPLPK